MQRKVLMLYFSVVIILMVLQSYQASLVEALWSIPEPVIQDPWFVATLMDAYFGFIAVFLWICYRERCWVLRTIWFILLMGLGNIAIAVYCLKTLWRAPADASLGEIFFGKPSGGNC